jgi:hypothetical protein
VPAFCGISHDRFESGGASCHRGCAVGLGGRGRIAQQRTSDSGRGGIPRKLFIILQNQGFGSILLPRQKRQKGVVT